MKNHLLTATVAVGSFAAGAFVGYKITEKKLGVQFEERLEKETKGMREFYTAVPQQKFATPEEAAAVLIPEDAGKALIDYQGGENKGTAYHKVPKVTRETIEGGHDLGVFKTGERQAVEAEAEIFNRNVFAEHGEPKDRPYVISEEAFMENDGDFIQVTAIWYAEDDVLCDEKEDPIEDIKETIGPDAYQKFGEQSSDERTVHIRNEKLRIDFEVVKNDGSYNRQVLGVDDDNPQTARQRINGA